jgi:hypothetical protein
MVSGTPYTGMVSENTHSAKQVYNFWDSEMTSQNNENSTQTDLLIMDFSKT